MKSRQGFTLVETSVVVAVIGLLSAVAIPSFQSVRAKSLNNAKKANVRMLNNAVEMWAMDNFLPGETAIDVAITNYLKGGVEVFQVGTQAVGMTNITQQTVGHIFTIEDLY